MLWSKRLSARMLGTSWTQDKVLKGNVLNDLFLDLFASACQYWCTIFSCSQTTHHFTLSLTCCDTSWISRVARWNANWGTHVHIPHVWQFVSWIPGMSLGTLRVWHCAHISTIRMGTGRLGMSWVPALWPFVVSLQAGSWKLATHSESAAARLSVLEASKRAKKMNTQTHENNAVACIQSIDKDWNGFLWFSTSFFTFWAINQCKCYPRLALQLITHSSLSW